MIKKDGKDYPISLFKMYLHDELFDKLDWMTTYLKVRDNTETMHIIINHLHSILKEQEAYYNGLRHEEKLKLEGQLKPPVDDKPRIILDENTKS